MIPIYLGGGDNEHIARCVLASSILRRTREHCDIQPVPPEYLPEAQCWSVPFLRQWQGVAIYLDPNQIVLADIAELLQELATCPEVGRTAFWASYTGGLDPVSKKVRRTPQPDPSIMVIDCAMAKTDGFGWQPALAAAYLSRPGITIDERSAFRHAAWSLRPAGALPFRWHYLARPQCRSWTASTSTNLKRGPLRDVFHYAHPDTWPWVEPRDPMARFWQTELRMAIQQQRLDYDDFLLALETGALHPFYKRYLHLFGPVTST